MLTYSPVVLGTWSRLGSDSNPHVSVETIEFAISERFERRNDGFLGAFSRVLSKSAPDLTRVNLDEWLPERQPHLDSGLKLNVLLRPVF